MSGTEATNGVHGETEENGDAAMKNTLIEDIGKQANSQKKEIFKTEDHPQHPKLERPCMKKLDDGTWGPTGLYGGRVKETELLRSLRDAVKPARLERIEKVLQARCSRVHCLFENLADPGNGASCLRTMEGLGLLEAHAVESYEPFHVQGGITINADKWMVVKKYTHCLDAANSLKKKGFTLIATCLENDAICIDDIDYSSMGKICVMFGNEERGLSWALRDTAHIKAYIPMVGFSQSFNISVSCAMMLFHLRERGLIKPDLDDERITDLYQRWLLMSAKRAITIVTRNNLEGELPDYL